MNDNLNNIVGQNLVMILLDTTVPFIPRHESIPIQLLGGIPFSINMTAHLNTGSVCVCVTRYNRVTHII